jgi:hypothetical protein
MFTLTRNHNITLGVVKIIPNFKIFFGIPEDGRENNKKFKVYVRTIHTFYCSGSEAECL